MDEHTIRTQAKTTGQRFHKINGRSIKDLHSILEGGASLLYVTKMTMNSETLETGMRGQRQKTEKKN